MCDRPLTSDSQSHTDRTPGEAMRLAVKSGQTGPRMTASPGVRERPIGKDLRGRVRDWLREIT